MVGQLLAITALFCLSFTSMASDLIGARSAKFATIEVNGLSEHSDDFAKRICADFKLHPRQVIFFFKRAKEIDSRTFTHDRYSPCYARGTVIFSDGTQGTWEIHSGKTALLTLEDGTGKILYCQQCRWKDPFEGGYSPH